MTWTKLSDDHFDREEIFNLSRSAALLNIEATVWCNRLLHDGHVPELMLGRITTSTDPQADVRELVASGVWEVDGNGWQIDWSEQRSAADVRASREANKDRQTAYRDRRERHGVGDHSACDARFCPAIRNAVTNADITPLVTAPRPDPSCPDPTRPVPKGQGQGQGGSADAATPPARRQLDPQGQQEQPARGTVCRHDLINGHILCHICTDEARPPL